MSTHPDPDPGPTVLRVDILPGQVLLQRYEVLRVLGRGAMGEVLEVRDRASGLAYALKRVPPELVRDTAQMQSIRENFALVSQLAHPHIATTRHLELDAATGHAYLLLELVHGTDLHHWLASRRESLGGMQATLPLPEVLGIGEQIAAALDYAHAQPVSRGPDGKPTRFGLLHRDLKPANVMVDTTREFRPGVPYVKLVDFGLAAEIQASLHGLSAAPRRENAAGTLSYMAPEQWEGRTLTRGVDQWALAVVLYDLAAGRKPFTAESSEALYLQVKRADPEAPARLTPAQWAAFRKAFSFDRRERYRSCVAFVRALAAADARTEGTVLSAEMPLPDEFAGVPPTKDDPPRVPAGDTRPPAPRRQPPRRPPWYLWPVAGLVLAVAALAAVQAARQFYAWSQHPPDPIPKPSPDPRPAPPRQPAAPEWKPLRIVWEDRPAFELWMSGTGFKHEGPARSSLAPVGGWIELQVHDEAHGQLFHELRWDGQPEIHLRQSGTVVEWSTQAGGPWKPLATDERATQDVGVPGLEQHPDLTMPSMLIRDPGVPGMLRLMQALRPAAVTCMRAERLELLEQVPTLRRVNLSGTQLFSASPLWNLKQLTAVDLNSSAELSTLAGIEELERLETVVLFGCPRIADLGPLAGLKRLRELFLPPNASGSDLRRLRDAGTLDGLVFLGLQDCDRVTNLDALRGLKHLGGLDLGGCKNILDLDELESLGPLRYLGLPPNVTATDLARLRQRGVLNKAVALMFSNSAQLENLDALDGLPELSTLTIAAAANLRDLKALGNLPGLREVLIQGALHETGAAGLPVLRKLRRLSLPGNVSNELLQRLRDAGSLDHLVSLSLQGNTQLTDPAPLLDLPNLRRLDLTGCTGLAANGHAHKLRTSLPACDIVGLLAPQPAAQPDPAPPEVPAADAAAEEQVLLAPIGFALREFPVPEGKQLKRGVVIGQLTGANLAAELQQAKAKLEAARATASLARRELERQRALHEQGLATQQALEEATAAGKNAEAAEGEAQLAHDRLETVVRNGGLTMPFDGVIVKYHAQVGEMVQAGAPFITVRKTP